MVAQMEIARQGEAEWLQYANPFSDDEIYLNYFYSYVYLGQVTAKHFRNGRLKLSEKEEGMQLHDLFGIS